MLKLVILDAYTLNQGDLSWDPLKAIAKCTVYTRTKPTQIIERALDADIILTNKVKLNKEVLSQLPKLKYVGVLATGYDNIDLESAKMNNVTVTNIPEYASHFVAQSVFSLILAITNRVHLHHESVKNGVWSACKDFTYHIPPLIDLSGLYLGLLGYGRIAKQVCQIAKAFNMNVIYHKPCPAKSNPYNARYVNFETIFSDSDILSLHCPLNDRTNKIINRSTLKLMKKKSILINTARGGLIDENALIASLKAGEIYAAGLDVLNQEPPCENHPLQNLHNCIITPHISWASYKSRHRLLEIATENIKCFLRGEAKHIVSSMS